MTRSELAEYLRATRDVEGWFFPIDAHLFAIVDEIQKREQITGGLFEIGVHHGKTALFLARMAAEEEELGVCDVFELQELNTDRSGEGSREIFLRNLRMQAPEIESRLAVHAIRSDTLDRSHTGTRCRFFHIDGGHLPADVVSDLRTAERAILPNGIVALDDLFNPSWPGVSEGFYRFAESTFLQPLLIGGNKVFFTPGGAVDQYEKHLSRVEEWRAFIAPQPFELERKRWLGRAVLTATRRTWVDLDPEGAAKLHQA